MVKVPMHGVGLCNLTINNLTINNYLDHLGWLFNS